MPASEQRSIDDRPPADDPRRLGAALGYLFTPAVPLLNLTGDQQSDPFVRRHALQALLWSVPFLLLLAIAVLTLIVLMRGNFLFICLLPVMTALPFVPGAVWARRIYLGGDVSIPVLSMAVRRDSS